jgi:hypothetical protein
MFQASSHERPSSSTKSLWSSTIPRVGWVSLLDVSCGGSVQLDSDIVGELRPGSAILFEASDNVLKGSRDKEELLFQTQYLADHVVIVGVL